MTVTDPTEDEINVSWEHACSVWEASYKAAKAERDLARSELARVVREANDKICRILNEHGLDTMQHPLVSSRLLSEDWNR